MSKPTKTPAMVLQELCMKKHFGPPQYQITDGTVSGTHRNKFKFQVKVADVVAIGIGSSKQLAKHEAAHNALMSLKESGVYDPEEDPVVKFKDVQGASKKASPQPQQTELKTTPNCILPLKEICIAHKIPEPVFEQKAEIGPPHCREFTYECQLLRTSLITIATSSTKKLAKQLAAQYMLEKIKLILPEVQDGLLEPAEGPAMAVTLPTVEEDVLLVYNRLYGSTVPDKTVSLVDYSDVFKKYMAAVEKTLDEFEDDLRERTEESFKRFLKKLGLEYHFYTMQMEPCMVALVVTTDTPFTLVEIEMSPEFARKKLLATAFDYINMWIRL